MKGRLSDIRRSRREAAASRGVNPRDVDVLLCDVLAVGSSYLFSHDDEVIEAEPLDALLARRLSGEPLQYVRGRAEFFGREFLVDPRVLIPRPETEHLVEAAIDRTPRGARVVDVGSGSGAIAVSLALERPDLRVMSVDISVGALAVARTNALKLGAHVAFVASDLLAATRGEFDVVVSNPPYIPAGDIASLAAEVRDHEPHGALTPGVTGLEVLGRLFADAARALVIVEIGFGQADAVARIAAAHGRAVDAVIPDLAGIPRVVVSSRAS